MYKKTLKYVSVLLITLIYAGCQNETEILNKMGENDNMSITLKSSGALLELSYEITSYTTYKYDYEKLTEIDLAHLNPSEEKQRIEMYIMPDGTVNMVIEELDFERQINIPHEISPSDVPEIKRTEIFGNNITFYDRNRSMLSSHNIEMDKQTELANQIKNYRNEFGYDETVRMFGAIPIGMSMYAIEKMINEAEAKGQLVVHNETFVTVRTNNSEIDPETTGSQVVLIDRSLNKIVASVTYDEMENMTSRTLIGYENGEIPLLIGYYTETLWEVPSGAEVWQITNTKFDKLNFNLKN